MIPSGECGSQHEDCRFWRMEICDESVDSLEFKAWINKNIIFAFSFAGFCPKFKSTGNGGADRDNAMSSGLSGLNGLYGFCWDMEPFGMHMMLFDVVGANWEESTEADMKSKILNLNAFFSEFLHKRFGHIETGGRSGGGTKLFCPNGLVTFNIVRIGIAMKIWWKWNIAIVSDDFSDVAAGSNSSGAVAENFFNGNSVSGSRIVVDIFDGKHVAGMEFTAVHNMVDFAIMFL